MPGGNVGPGVSVDLREAFAAVGPIDAATRRVRVGVGTTLGRLNDTCRPHRLHLPVDPSSGARCTLGGMLANNSAGPHSVRHGSTRRWVQAIDLVLADGSLARAERGVAPTDPALQRIARQVDAAIAPHAETIRNRWPQVRKNSSGYALREYLDSGDLIDLLIGSEGTLAFMTGAEVRLDALPGAVGLALLEFTDLARAGEAIPHLLAEDPATCEMLDRTFLELVRSAGADSGYPLRPDLEAILLVEMDGQDVSTVEARLAAVSALAGRLGARFSLATDRARIDSFHALRRAASPLIAEQAGHRVSMQFIEDCVVPVPHLAAFVTGLRAILGRHALPAVIFGHAGDGNLHVNPLVDTRRPDWIAGMEQVLDEVAALVAGLGGTLSGEHGDGRLRAPMLESIWGPELVGLFRDVKAAFDPRGILNPGVILPLPGQRPFDHIRPQP